MPVATWLKIGLAVIGIVSSSHLMGATPFQDYLQQSPELKRPEAGYQTGNFGKFAPNALEFSRGFLSFPLGIAFDEQRGPLQVSVNPIYNPGHGIGPFGFGFALDLSIHRYRLQGTIGFDDSDLWQSPWGVLAKGNDGFYYPEGLAKKVRVSIQQNEVIAWLDTRQVYKFQLPEKVPDGTYGYYLTRVEDAQGHVTLIDHERTDGGYYFPKLIRYGGRDADRLPYRLEFISEELPTEHFSIDFSTTDTRMLDRRIKALSFSSFGRARYSYEFQYESGEYGSAFHLRSVQKVFASGLKDPAQTFQYPAPSAPDSAYQKYSGLDALVSRYGAAFLQGEGVSFYDYNRDGLQDIEVAEDYRLYIQTADGFKESVQFVDNSSECFPKSGVRHLARKVLPLQGYRSPLQVVLTQRGTSDNEFSLISCTLEGEVQYRTSIPMNLTPDRFLRWVDLNRDGRVDLVRLEGDRLRIQENRSTETTLQFSETIPVQLPGNFRSDAIWFADINGDGLVDFVSQSGLALSVFFGYRDFGFLSEPFIIEIFNIAGRAFNPAGYSLEIIDLNGDGLGDLSLTKGRDRFVFRNNGREFRQLDIPSRAGSFNEGESYIIEIGPEAAPTIVRLDGSGSAFSLELAQRHRRFLQSWNDGRGTRLDFEYGTLVGVPGQESARSYLAAVTRYSVGMGTKRTEFNVDRPILHSRVAMLLGYEHVVMSDKLTQNVLKFLHRDEYAGILLESSSQDLKIPGLQTRLTNVHKPDTFQGISWPRLDQSIKMQMRDAGSMVETQKLSGYDHNLCPSRSETVYQRETLIKDFTYWKSSAADPFMSCLPSTVIITGQHVRMDLNFTHRAEVQRQPNGDLKRTEMVHPLDPSRRMFIQDISYDALHRPISFEAMEGLKTTLAYEGDSNLPKSMTSGFGLKEEVAARDLYDQISEYAVFQNASSPWVYSFKRDGRERLSGSWDLGFGSKDRPLLAISYKDPTTDKAGSLEFSRYHALTGATHHWSDVYNADGVMMAEFEKFGKGYLVKDASRFLDAERISEIYPLQTAASDDYESLELMKPLSRVEGSGIFDQFQAQTQVDADSTKAVQYDYLVSDVLQKIETTNSKYLKRWDINSRGEVVGYTDEENFKTSYEYDALGRLRIIALPDGKKHTVVLDDFGRTKRISRTEIGAVEYDYNKRSLVSDKRYFDTKGILDRSSHHEYDVHGRKVLDVFSKGSDIDTIRYYYDGNTFDGKAIAGQLGRLTQVQGSVYLKTWVYDAKGRLVTDEQAVAARTGKVVRMVSMGYDENDRIVSQKLKLQDGAKVLTYETIARYDASGRQQKLMLNGRDLLTFGYSTLGLNDSISGPDFTLSMEFDPFTQGVKGFSYQNFEFGQVPAAYRMELGDRGFAESEVYEQNGGSSARSYLYTPRGFLQKATIGSVDYTYGYDANGLITTIADRNGSRSFSHEPLLTQEVNGKKLALDAMSRIVEIHGISLKYGSRGVVSSTKSAESYSAFVLDEADSVYFTQGIVDEIHFGQDLYKDGTYLQPIKRGSQLIGWLENGVFKPAISDFRGTPLFARGTALSLDPFGAGETQGLTSASLHFAGHGLDEASGLVRMGVRQYYSSLGMFLSSDPLFLESPDECIKSPRECNLFVYAQNSPISNVDETGLSSAEISMRRFESQVLAGDSDKAMLEAKARAVGAAVGASVGLAALASEPILVKAVAMLSGLRRGSAGRVSETPTQGSNVNRFEEAISKLTDQGKANVTALREWAKSKGYIRVKNSEGGPEIWGEKIGKQISWRLKIKPESSTRPGLEAGSNQPRFDARTGEGKYINPLTGDVGGKSVGTHVPLQ